MASGSSEVIDTPVVESKADKTYLVRGFYPSIGLRYWYSSSATNLFIDYPTGEYYPTPTTSYQDVVICDCTAPSSGANQIVDSTHTASFTGYLEAGEPVYLTSDGVARAYADVTDHIYGLVATSIEVTRNVTTVPIVTFGLCTVNVSTLGTNAGDWVVGDELYLSVFDFNNKAITRDLTTLSQTTGRSIVRIGNWLGNNKIAVSSFTNLAKTSKTIMPVDNSVTVQFKLDSSLPCVNSGNGGTITLAAVNGAGNPYIQQTSINRATAFSRALSVSEATSIEPGDYFTFSLWVILLSYSGEYAQFAGKLYSSDNQWTDPPVAFNLSEGTGLDGSWQAGVCINGVLQKLDCTNRKIILNEPTFLAVTYDGSTINSYHNGILCSTTSVSGTVSYGTHGSYYVGAKPTFVQTTNALISDIRAESTVRSQQYLESVYKRRMGWPV